jgi:SAM-dependent methyltransferase
MSIISWLDSKLYPGYDDYWAERRFRSYILDKLNKGDSILDLGAGRGQCEELNFKGLVRFVAGVDPDPIVHKNLFLDEASTLPLPEGKIPYDDNTFDLIFTNCVLEHVQDPEVLFREAYRVLRPNGSFLSKTPNKWHYVATIARLTPNSLHAYIKRRYGVEAHDTFPTVYKCNTPKDIMTYAENAGFEVIEIQMWDGRPEYLRIWMPTYLLGYLYERAVHKFSFLSRFRVVIVFALRKSITDPQNEARAESMRNY